MDTPPNDATTKPDRPGRLRALTRSPLTRMLALGLLVLLLQIPVWLIKDAISEREQTRQQAVAEVTGKWGEQQVFTGPVITVPYIRRWVEACTDGTSVTREELNFATFLPDRLAVQGQMDAEVRYRGIYEVPVFRMAVTVSGAFSQPSFDDWHIPDADILWDRAYLSLGVSDARAITNAATLTWNSGHVPFRPSSGEAHAGVPGIHVPLKGQLHGGQHDFSTALKLNGSNGVYFAPMGRTTEVRLRSNWTDPSFQGQWLPVRREVSQRGFTATWNIPALGRNYPQQWLSGGSWVPDNLKQLVSQTRFGVDLLSPVDHYRMAHRSLKYQLLFLSLTFIVLWLFEVRGGLRIHPIQYLLVGFGLCMFYLLELSLAEHIGFLPAYALATVSVVAMVAGYCGAILRSLRRALTVGASVTALYAALYVLLMNQDYALLMGSVGLFAVLAAIMFLTRRIDWSAPGS